jgi:hypothetical protein
LKALNYVQPYSFQKERKREREREWGREGGWKREGTPSSVQCQSSERLCQDFLVRPSLATRLPPPARALVLDTEIKCAVPIAITIHNIYYIKHTHTHTHTHTKHKYVIIYIIYLFYIIYMRHTTNYTAVGDANSFTQ